MLTMPVSLCHLSPYIFAFLKYSIFYSIIVDADTAFTCVCVCHESLRVWTCAHCVCPATRFRPNIVVQGCNGPWQEDQWLKLSIGNVAMKVIHTIEMKTRTITSYRQHHLILLLVQNCVCHRLVFQKVFLFPNLKALADAIASIVVTQPKQYTGGEAVQPLQDPHHQPGNWSGRFTEARRDRRSQERRARVWRVPLRRSRAYAHPEDLPDRRTPETQTLGQIITIIMNEIECVVWRYS